jgi:hypothetical protein
MKFPGRVIYGWTVPEGKEFDALLKHEFIREAFFFRKCRTLKGYEGGGRYEHGRKIVEMMWPKIIKWEINGVPNAEMEDLWAAFCSDDEEIMVTGHKKSSKSTLAAAFGMVWWLALPMASGVLLGSTTIGGLKMRIWSEVRKLYFGMPQGFRESQQGWGIVEQPTPSVQPAKGEKKHGVHGVPIGGASESNALDMLRGFHPLRPCVIFDECTSISKAILKEVENVMGGDCKLIGLGNAASIFDMHGQMCEPRHGWNEVNTETRSWKTKRGGTCLYLDGEKAPCVELEVQDHPYLFCLKDKNTCIERHGFNSPEYWREVRGFWCPEGVVKSVLSQSQIQAGLAMTPAEWSKQRRPVKIAMLDPAFEGGDRCVLRFALCGQLDIGTDAIEYGDTNIIRLDVQSKTPIHFQIANRVIEQCQRWGVKAEDFAMDTTGEGGGVASILKEKLFLGFLEVEFGRRADDDVPAGINDDREASAVFKNHVTQLWYSFRESVQFSMVRGLDAETCIEACNRLYASKGSPERISLESKAEMKARGLRSPDLMDAAVVGHHLARKRGYLGKAPSRARKKIREDWLELEKEFEQPEALFITSGIDAVLNFY